jgi:hypothetical protein
MSVEHGLNDTDRGELKYLEKNPSQHHFFHYKCHVDEAWDQTRAVAVKGQ